MIPARALPGLLVAAAAIAGCARPAVAPAPEPEHRTARQLRTEAEVDAVATLLRMEDRRELDPALLDDAAAFANAEVRR
ncbi:MAG TPA: hypothetical protein VGR37_24575, partial [Longimicrobiaceae bacterium]|nr:hypothetical protein [Longimicrobiaceae bacterium]